ncbi:hypothetical protein HETIRDRAFT_410381 [Heterobasidion irregulare TC 32-1]|uniref:Uncharacterized protein n=1 Tax=Heterobasidion irregulare (strain TC 32-1) TaxID=747525 RepID=W4K1I0_HETIT|nr:uncharacterized protein HETIRDRAFT_410381 [Heterobasidion irregulare TC 32-1]ETW79667.1 hypothetical protein HETIRDRAFT_410381 [Heterobasidion irregulare TC 32-1]
MSRVNEFIVICLIDGVRVGWQSGAIKVGDVSELTNRIMHWLFRGTRFLRRSSMLKISDSTQPLGISLP